MSVITEPATIAQKPSDLVLDDGGIAVPRVLGRMGMEISGPTLVCVGGLHGNEPAGVLALGRVLARLATETAGLRGRFIALSGNRRALARRRRYLVTDLNRHWTREQVERLRRAEGALEAEDAELRELDTELEQIFTTAPGEVACFDLHTVSGPGRCFLTADKTRVNRELAVRFPIPIVLGLERELEGTLTRHLSAHGIRNLGLESGQHDDPSAVDRAEDAIWVALEIAGVLGPGSREVAAARARLTAETEGLPHVVELGHRHVITPGDGFRMLPGFSSFQPVEKGQVLARDRQGEVCAPFTGLILMPLYQELGEDGFFMVREVGDELG